MKILYVGHFHNNSGWSQAALDYLFALDRAGVDVIPRSIRLNNQNPELPARYTELEAKNCDDCDIVIQHVLPHHLAYDGKFKKNIALCVYESGGTWLHNWSSKINMMDELWVPSMYTLKCFESGGVTIPITVVPHTFNMDKYTKEYEKLHISEFSGDYVFYTIADLNVRKNLSAIIKAFHREFTINEPVSLLIKCSKYGANPDDLFEIIRKDCSQIKEHMKLYTKNNLYKSEFLLTSRLTDEDVCKIHKTCHCYVNTSHGESWCIPLYEAMAFGNQVVCPKNMYDFINVDCNTFDTYTDINLRCLDTFKEIGSSHETWQEMSIVDISREMRNCYNDYKNDSFYETKKLGRMYSASEYSYDNVGRLMKGILECRLQ